MSHTPVYTQDWFSLNIPNWTKWLARFVGQPSRFLEIGSYEGRSTVWLLENVLTHEHSTITCVDPYLDSATSQGVNGASAKVQFIYNVAPWREKVLLLTCRSCDALPTLRGAFDFIYVDGSHLSFHVYADAMLSWPLLAPGGLLIFDDYTFTVPGWEFWKLTALGIDMALSDLRGYELIYKEQHQVVLRKRL